MISHFRQKRKKSRSFKSEKNVKYIVSNAAHGQLQYHSIMAGQERRSALTMLTHWQTSHVYQQSILLAGALHCTRPQPDYTGRHIATTMIRVWGGHRRQSSHDCGINLLRMRVDQNFCLIITGVSENFEERGGGRKTVYQPVVIYRKWLDQSINQTNYFIVRLTVDQRARQLSMPHLGITRTGKNRTKT